MAAVLALACLGLAAWAAEQAGEPVSSLVRMKAGVCKFTLLEASNMKPIGGREVSLTSSADGAALAKTATDRSGACSLDVSVGRFILGIDGQNVAIVEGQETSDVTECRILVPEGGLSVGGLKPPARLLALIKSKPVIIGSVAVLGAGGGYVGYREVSERRVERRERLERERREAEEAAQGGGALGGGGRRQDDEPDDDDDDAVSP